MTGYITGPKVIRTESGGDVVMSHTDLEFAERLVGPNDLMEMVGHYVEIVNKLEQIKARLKELDPNFLDLVDRAVAAPSPEEAGNFERG